MQTHSCQSHMGIYASTEMHPLFFFFFLYLFPSYEPIPDEQRNPFLEALFTTGILFLRESIPYFLQATLTMPFAFLFSFFVILGQFLPFSFCFDKGFRSA